MQTPTARCVIESDLLRVEVDQQIGASITDLAVKGPRDAWWPMLRRSTATVIRGEDTACYLLAPWSNRIRDGLFEFEGRPIHVRTNWPDGTAIHGDVRDRAWKILDRSPVSVRLAFDSREHLDTNWPWMFTCEARYEVDGGVLEADLKIRNVDDADMPCGGGFHPFFHRVLWDVADDPVVTAAVTGRYPCEHVMVVGDAGMERVSEALAGGTRLHEPLDDIFECPSGEVEIRWPASGVSARFKSSEEFGKVVIFVPLTTGGSPMPFFCVEPVSMVNDGFNLVRKVATHGVRVLRPGEELAMKWTLDVRRGP